MPDRLAELQRQRALAQEQLAWFDREIAREAGVRQAATSPSAATPPPVVPTAPPAHSPDADALIRQYQSSGKSIHHEVKRGCLLYFFAAFALLAAGLAAFAFFWRR